MVTGRKTADFYWPTPQQELLLRAAVLRGPEALKAWARWKSSVDIDRLDVCSQRLLPLVYRMLRTEGVSEPDTGRWVGFYRRTWYENQLRFHAAARMLRALHDAGIQTMLLKGTALILQYYRDYGLRPMADIDVLVHPHQAQAATAVLKRLGFAPIPESLWGRTEAEALATGYELEFSDPARQQADLHWHVFYRRLGPGADVDLWTDAIPILAKGVPTRTMSAADQLLHVCVHGTQMWWDGRAESNLRWIVDAMVVLQASRTPLDWDRLLVHAQRYRFMLPLRETLGYLRDVFDAPVPGDVMQRLTTVRVSRSERILHRASTHPPESWGPWLALGVRYLEYAAALPDETNLFERLLGLLKFLRRRWRTRSLFGMASVAVFRGIRRIGWVGSAHWRRLRANPRFDVTART